MAVAVAVTGALGQSGGEARSSFGAGPRGEAAAADLGKVDLPVIRADFNEVKCTSQASK